MRVMRLKAPGAIETAPLELTEVSIPEPGPDQVRLRVTVCGVCHTDLHIAEGDIHPPKLPRILGHQVVGVVDALGSEVRQPSLGRRVGLPWLYDACGECAFCQRGEENLCPQARFTGFHVDGGFGEFVLASAKYVLPLPEGISDEQTAPLLCAGIIGYRSLRKSDMLPGERLGLVGFGASAHLSIQVAHHWGCEVFVFTRSPEHRRHARELGAAWVGGVEDDIPEMLDRAVIFAPVGSLVPQMLTKLRPGGILVLNAIHMSPLPEMPYELIYGERTIRSVANATFQDGVEFLRLAVEIPIRSTVQRYSLEEANRALDDLKHSRFNGEAVLCVSS
ncbi:MAG: zinc-dependent alcohol dehydrogenase family protein [Chloroflexota bacterium]